MHDFSAMKRSFEALVKIPEDEWARFLPRIRVIEAAKGDTLLRQGEPVDWLGFLDRGLLRMVRNTGEREVNLGFELEGGYVGAYEAYMTRTPAKFSLDALEASVVFAYDRTLLEAVVAEHPCWRELMGRGAEVELVRKLQADVRARTQTPEECYAELSRTNSALLRRVPQYHLASYLGIAPETLSRIRARTSAPARRDGGSRS